MQRGVERGLGRGTDRLADPDHVEASEQVGERDAQQLVAAQAPHHLHGAGGIGLTLHGLDHGRVQLGRAPGHELVVAGQHLQRIGRARQHRRDVAAGGEHVGQPRRDLALVAQQAQVPGRLAQRVRHLPVGEQAGVGLGRVGEVGQQDGQQRALQRGAARQARRERLDVAKGRGRIGEPERGEPAAGLIRGQPQGFGGHPGHGFEQRPVEELLVQPPHLAGVQRPLGLEDLGR